VGIASVFIGLSVYNGKRYISKAIESLLSQSFEDFEFLISDNASTDGTWEICREYAAMDCRISLERNERNLGAFTNFRLVFDRSESPYFMWMSHDDLLHRDYVRNCYDFLASHPDYVLCCSKNGYIDEDGNENDAYQYSMNKYFGVESDDMEERFDACLENLPPPAVMYGLIRKAAMAILGRYGQGYLSSSIRPTRDRGPVRSIA
jgi:glycosyltransferase involved in cell wall biosynthesis